MKRLLVVVDFQNDFVSGSLSFDKAKALEDHIVNLIKEYHMNGDEIVYTMDTHTQNYLETYEGAHLPIEHCIEPVSYTHLHKLHPLTHLNLRLK